MGEWQRANSFPHPTVLAAVFTLLFPLAHGAPSRPHTLDIIIQYCQQQLHGWSRGVNEGCEEREGGRETHLGDLTSSLDADTHVQVGEVLLAQQVEGLHDLHAQDLGLQQLNGGTYEGREGEEAGEQDVGNE